MELLIRIFGEGKELSALQMGCRAAVVFIIACLLIRISGRRSFGLKRTLDNVIVILLGAVLSRAVSGASPFIPTIAASLVIVLMHRLFAFFSTHSETFSQLVNGKAIVLYKDGSFNRKNMDRCLVRDEDVMEQVRMKANVESIEKIACVRMEKNGELSVVKKEE